MFLQQAQQLDPNFTIDAETIAPVVQICHWWRDCLGHRIGHQHVAVVELSGTGGRVDREFGFLAADTRDLPHEQRTLQAVFERSWRLLAGDEQQLLARLAIFPGSFA
ncbi:MAG: hypothetical protein R3A44_13180 [Caldilineaceae bacterium]